MICNRCSYAYVCADAGTPDSNHAADAKLIHSVCEDKRCECKHLEGTK